MATLAWSGLIKQTKVSPTGLMIFSCFFFLFLIYIHTKKGGKRFAYTYNNFCCYLEVNFVFFILLLFDARLVDEFKLAW